MRDSDESLVDRGFFRCPVQDDESSATVYIRGRKIPVLLQDKSIDGFSILVERRHANKLQMGPQWILHAGDERTEVLAQWMFNAPDGCVQIGLRRLQDLTPLPKQTWFPALRPYNKHTTSPEVLFAGFVLVIFLALSLPGLGDHLGTSGVIQQGVVAIYEFVTNIGNA